MTVGQLRRRLTKTGAKGKKSRQPADGCAYARLGEDVPYVRVHAATRWPAYSVNRLRSDAQMRCPPESGAKSE